MTLEQLIEPLPPVSKSELLRINLALPLMERMTPEQYEAELKYQRRYEFMQTLHDEMLQQLGIEPPTLEEIILEDLSLVKESNAEDKTVEPAPEEAAVPA